MEFPPEINAALEAEGLTLDAQALDATQAQLANSAWRWVAGRLQSALWQGVNGRYPGRVVLPFAKRDDCDDVACLVVRDPEREPCSVVVIHNYASPGYEVSWEADDLEGWWDAAGGD